MLRGASERRTRTGRGLGRAALVLVLVSGCRGTSDDGPLRDMDPAPEGSTGAGASTGEVFEPSEDATDQCAVAPTIGAGRHYGSMRGNASELSGSCGQGGPDAFFRLEVPRRSDVWLQGVGVGFSPRIGVLPHTCTTDWGARTMACTQGVGTWLLDVPAGSSLVLAVGIDSEHPALDQAPPTEGVDPLAFALDVGLRNVLGEGDACEPPGRGRCGTGTVCLAPPPEDPEAGPVEAVCTAVAGDTCGSAVLVPVTPGGISVEIDPAAVHTDAHVHSCGGARSAERVLQLQLPSTSELHGLEVRVDDPRVGLALRAPGCLPADERGCTDPDQGGGGLLTAEVAGSEAFLFIELSAMQDDAEGTGTGTTGGDTAGEEAPIVVDIDVFDPPAPR